MGVRVWGLGFCVDCFARVRVLMLLLLLMLLLQLRG